MRSTVTLLLIVAATAPALAAKIPSWIKPCKRSDPKLNECALKNGKEALPFIIRGDPKLGVPKLDPLVISKIVVGDGKVGPGGLGLTFTCEKCTFYGLKGINPTVVRVDLKARHLELEGTIPRLEIKGRYTATGKVLVLPIQGDGQANLVLSNLSLKYTTDYDLKKNPKDGKEYITIKNSKMTFNAKGFNIKLTNLFKGDKGLGEQMNVFLNQNWRDVLTEFGPAVSEAVNRIVSTVVNNISSKVPLDALLN